MPPMTNPTTERQVQTLQRQRAETSRRAAGIRQSLHRARQVYANKQSPQYLRRNAWQQIRHQSRLLRQAELQVSAIDRSIARLRQSALRNPYRTRVVLSQQPPPFQLARANYQTPPGTLQYTDQASPSLGWTPNRSRALYNEYHGVDTTPRTYAEIKRQQRKDRYHRANPTAAELNAAIASQARKNWASERLRRIREANLSYESQVRKNAADDWWLRSNPPFPTSPPASNSTPAVYIPSPASPYVPSLRERMDAEDRVETNAKRAALGLLPERRRPAKKVKFEPPNVSLSHIRRIPVPDYENLARARRKAIRAAVRESRGRARRAKYARKWYKKDKDYTDRQLALAKRNESLERLREALRRAQTYGRKLQIERLMEDAKRAWPDTYEDTDYNPETGLTWKK